MLYNYFKTAFRNLSSHKGYALISTFGLGLGMAAAISIFLVIRFETSFDSFHPWLPCSLYNNTQRVTVFSLLLILLAAPRTDS